MTKAASQSALQGPKFKGSRVCVLFATRVGRRRRGVSVKVKYLLTFIDLRCKYVRRTIQTTTVPHGYLLTGDAQFRLAGAVWTILVAS